MILDPDGSEVDWFVGYSPPPEKYQEQVDRALQGIETFKSLSALYAKDPKNIEVVFKLAAKHGRRYQNDKAAELYRQVIALDPEGKMGMTDFENEKVSYTQNAEFNLGAIALTNRPPDPAPLQAFVKKYPDSRIVKEAYSRLSSSYYTRTASKEDAAKFYEEYTGRYPQDSQALMAWVLRIIDDKGPSDKGIELAQKAIQLGSSDPRLNTTMNLSLARLYLLNGDKVKAVETAEQLLKTTSGNPMVLSGAAEVFVEADQIDKALAIYGSEYLKANIGNASLLGRYAQFWSRQGKNLESALEAGRKAVELTPDNFMTWNTLSQVYLKLKNYDEALKAAEKAMEIAPAQQAQAKEFIKKNIEEIKAAAEKDKK
jgi:tetratricopeptide (TPR) repeat protein